jgi:hypothetical protein
MSTLTSTLTIDVDDLEASEVLELRAVITKTLAGFSAGELDPEAVYGWTVELCREFHRRLAATNRPVQAKVLEAAARNGGFCSREDVYLLGDYEASRSLTGFSKPIKRVGREMAAEGILAADALTPLSPDYDPSVASFQRARGFVIPAEIVDVFAEALAS